jgi:hypothetical protein
VVQKSPFATTWKCWKKQATGLVAAAPVEDGGTLLNNSRSASVLLHVDRVDVLETDEGFDEEQGAELEKRGAASSPTIPRP